MSWCSPVSGHGVELLRSEAEDLAEIAPQFKEGETIYTPGYLHSSLFGTTWFAREPAEYGLPSNLFWNAADLFCRYMGFSRELAAFMTGVVFCSWFPDCCARPMTLCITGDMDQVMKLFRLLRAVCRRALVVAELSLSLPPHLVPDVIDQCPEDIGESCGALARFELLVARSFQGPGAHCAISLAPG